MGMHTDVSCWRLRELSLPHVTGQRLCMLELCATMLIWVAQGDSGGVAFRVSVH